MTLEELKIEGYQVHENCMKMLAEIQILQRKIQENNAILEKIRQAIDEKEHENFVSEKQKKLTKNDRFPCDAEMEVKSFPIK